MKKQIRLCISDYMPFNRSIPTNFAAKIKSGEKIHTIRYGYNKWAEKARKINAGTHKLVVFRWTGKPYRSKTETLFEFEKIGVQKITMELFHKKILIPKNGMQYISRVPDIAHNDGLELRDFAKWFSLKKTFDELVEKDLAIIHFTEFRYNGAEI